MADETETLEYEEEEVEETEPESEESEAAAQPEEDAVDGEEAEDTDAGPEVEAPRFWSAEEREHFQSLNPEAQEIIARKERERDADHRSLRDELAQERNSLKEQKEQINQERQRLAEQAKAFESALSPPDEDLNDPDSDKYDPDEYRRQQRAYKERKQKVDEAKQEYEEAQKKAWEDFRSEQVEIYRQEMPEFLDKEKGPQLHQDLTKFAAETLGVSEEEAANALRQTPAKQMMILRDAMRYREAQNVRQKAKKKPPKTAKPGTSSKKSQPKSAAEILYG